MAGPTQPLAAVSDDRAYDWFAILLLMGVFAFLGATFWCVPKLPGDTLGMVLGAMLAWIGQIVGFKWGSSLSSQKKDETINKLSKAP